MKPFGEPGQRSLLLEILDWMVAPLAVVWPVSLAVTYAIGMSIADAPFDRELRERVLSVVDDVTRPGIRVPGPRALLSLQRIRADRTDHRTFAHVADEKGVTLVGDEVIPAPHRGECVRGEVHFRNDVIEEVEVRIACRVVMLTTSEAPVLVQIAESVDRRHEHARHVTHLMMGVVLILVPLTVSLVGFALYRGLEPIRRLQKEIDTRAASDLTPLDASDAPTEIAPLLETLNRQLERVRGNVELQRRFIADAAHQLKTPLAALKTQAQVGQHAKSLDESAERLAHIAQSADHLGRLASQLLALARADDAKPGPAAPVDLGELLRVAGRDLADAAIAKGIGLDLDVPEGKLEVTGDANLLHELFVNLLDNAVRYTPAGGKVEARAIAVPVPTIEIEDDGPGIPKTERRHVFERFYRVLGTGVEGSGLGLSIVKSIADRHRASVEIASGAGGRGTLVRVSFPSG